MQNPKMNLRCVHRALTRHAEHVQRLRARPYALPAAAEDRRRLFTLVMTRKPELGRAFVTDADIQSCLEHLGALGVLREFEELGEG